MPRGSCGFQSDCRIFVPYPRDDIYISLMNQYTPMSGVPEELRHKVKNEEYEELIDFAVDLGIENGFVQEGNTAERLYPPV